MDMDNGSSVHKKTADKSESTSSPVVTWRKRTLAFIAVWLLLLIGLFTLMLTPLPLYSLLNDSLTSSPGIRSALGLSVMFILGGASLFSSWKLHRWLRSQQILVPYKRFTHPKYANLTREQWQTTLNDFANRNGVSLEFLRYGKSNEYRRLALSISVSSIPGEFQVYRETLVDKAAKKLGISREHQTGDMRFDDNHYLVSDLPQGMESLLQHSLIRLAIKNLIHLGFIQLQYTNGTLFAFGPLKGRLFFFTDKDEFRRNEIGMVLHGVKQLRYLGRRILRTENNRLLSPTIMFPSQARVGYFAGAYIPKQAEKELARHRPTFIARRKIIFLLPLVALILGGLYWLGKDIFLDNAYPMLDTGGFAHWILLSSSVVLVIWLVAALIILSGRSRSHKEILVGVCLAGMGLPTFTSAVIAWTNVALDHTPPIIHSIMVTDKGKNYSHRSGTDYWVRFKSAPDIDEQKIDLPREIWVQFQKDHKIDILMHPGYWKWPWLEGLAPRDRQANAY